MALAPREGGQKWGRLAGCGFYFIKSIGNGGEGGIRTPDALAGMPHFECGAFNRSATSPQGASMRRAVPSMRDRASQAMLKRGGGRSDHYGDRLRCPGQARVEPARPMLAERVGFVEQ